MIYDFLTRRMMGGGGSSPTPPTPLPYQQVEYLESTGTQFIRALSALTALGTSWRFRMRAKFTDVPTSGYYIAGFTSNAAQFFVGLNSAAATGLYMCFASNTNNTIASQISNDKTDWHNYEVVRDADGTKYYLDGTLIKSHANSITAITYIYLFAGATTGAAVNAYSKMQIASASLSIGGAGVFDYVSVRDGQTGYMYDKVSQTLFGNAGTEDFVVGPDITD